MISGRKRRYLAVWFFVPMACAAFVLADFPSPPPPVVSEGDPVPDDMCIEDMYWIGISSEEVDPALLQTWVDQGINPFEVLLEPEPDDDCQIGALIYLDLPTEGGRCQGTIAVGEVNGLPGCWTVTENCEPDRTSDLYPECCIAAGIACNYLDSIWWIGWMIPDGKCQECFAECWYDDPVREDPCHACEPWGLMWILCNWFGSCG